MQQQNCSLREVERPRLLDCGSSGYFHLSNVSVWRQKPTAGWEDGNEGEGLQTLRYNRGSSVWLEERWAVTRHRGPEDKGPGRQGPARHQGAICARISERLSKKGSGETADQYI